MADFLSARVVSPLTDCSVTKGTMFLDRGGYKK
jgi:hypothetical protein